MLINKYALNSEWNNVHMCYVMILEIGLIYATAEDGQVVEIMLFLSRKYPILIHGV
jgi:hypothetical protein